jgi:hypothetical protein
MQISLHLHPLWNINLGKINFQSCHVKKPGVPLKNYWFIIKGRKSECQALLMHYYYAWVCTLLWFKLFQHWKSHSMLCKYLHLFKTWNNNVLKCCIYNLPLGQILYSDNKNIINIIIYVIMFNFQNMLLVRSFFFFKFH